MFDFIRGSTFKLIGQFKLDGQPRDFTGSTVIAQVSDITGGQVVSALTPLWIDSTQGVLQLSAGDTSAWAPQKARIDLSITDAAGSITTAQPDYFRITQGPING